MDNNMGDSKEAGKIPDLFADRMTSQLSDDFQTGMELAWTG